MKTHTDMIIAARRTGADCASMSFDAEFDAVETVESLALDIREWMSEDTGMDTDTAEFDAVCLAWAEAYHFRTVEMSAEYAAKLVLAED